MDGGLSIRDEAGAAPVTGAEVNVMAAGCEPEESRGSEEQGSR